MHEVWKCYFTTLQLDTLYAKLDSKWYTIVITLGSHFSVLHFIDDIQAYKELKLTLNTIVFFALSIIIIIIPALLCHGGKYLDVVHLSGLTCYRLTRWGHLCKSGEPLWPTVPQRWTENPACWRKSRKVGYKRLFKLYWSTKLETT